jgi:phenylpyruvate tautomerase PptA (4-oxalocrotonate tautomerase family)
MLGKLIEPVSKILDKFVQDKDQKAALAHEIATMAEQHAQELALAQIAVNKAEASNGNLFVAGWRPAIGWICGAALALAFYTCAVNDRAAFAWAGADAPELPAFDMQSLMTDFDLACSVWAGCARLKSIRAFQNEGQF